MIKKSFLFFTSIILLLLVLFLVLGSFNTPFKLHELFKNNNKNNNQSNFNYLTITEEDFNLLSIKDRWIYRSKMFK